MTQPADIATELIARAAEQQNLDAALKRVRTGRGGVALIAGEPGIGKSSLARWAAAQARTMGLGVAWGFCWEAGRAPPYWPWTQCLRSVLEERKLPAQLLRAVAQWQPGIAERADASRLTPDQARFRLLDSARALVSAAAEAGPLLIILEDLHAADHDSLLLLEYLCPHLESLAVLLIGTFREGEAHLSGETSPLWRCARNAIVLRPRAFDLVAIQAFLARVSDTLPDGALASRVQEITEGNPLFVAEISALLGREAVTQVPTALPASLQQVIRQHLEVLPATSRELLAQAAVLGREFDVASLTELAGQSEEVILGALQPAVLAGLLRAADPGRFRFTHIFYRDTLYAGLEPARRAQLHLQRAHSLQRAVDAGLSGHFAELAEQLAAAGPRLRPDAVKAWRKAARHARDRLAFTESCELYRHAMEAFGAGPGADPSERCQLMLEWARVELESGRLESGRNLCSEAFSIGAAMESTGIMAQAALTYGSAFVIGRVDPVLIRLLRQSLQALGAGDNGLRARLQARLAAALQPAADPSEPIRMAREAIALARRTGDDEALYEVLASAVSALADFAPANERMPLNREYAELARARGDVTAEFRAHALLMIDAIECADAAAFEAAIEACERLARQIGLPHYDWRVESARALQACIAGDFESAGRRIERASEHAARAGDAVAEMTLAIQEFCRMSEAGQLGAAEFEAMWSRIETACSRAGAEDLYLRPLVARHLLRQGDTRAAQAVCGPGATERLIAMHQFCDLEMVGACAALSGDVALAARIRPLLEPCAGSCSHAGLYGMTWNGPIARTLGLLCHLLGDEAAARIHLENARQVALRMGADWMAQRIEGELREIGTSPAPMPAATAPSARPEALSLQPDGEVYVLGFRGQTALLQPTRGMEWLAQLVGSPGREWHVLDLASPAGTPLDDAGTGPLLDDRARRAYRQRLRALEDEIAEARERHDADGAEKLLAERESLQRELVRAFGIDGRSRPAGQAAERARVNVTRRLRDAIRRIAGQFPEAGAYLEKTVKTGRYCSYTPL